MNPKSFPPELRHLYPREREIAEMIYERGWATANEVQAGVSDALTNSAVRSLLARLVRKGILGRELKDCSTEYIYYAAISSALSGERALKQLAEDFFEGSVQEAAAVVVGLARRAREHRPAAG